VAGPSALPVETVPGLVSTVVPVHNRAGMLADAVGSVLAQTYRPIEVILVDDGSTDGTPEACRQLAERQPGVVRALRRENGGPGAARETGRRAARGEFLQYLDSDDLLLPDKFSRQVEALRSRPDCGVAYCFTRFYRVGSPPGDVPWKGSGESVGTMFPSLLVERWWDTPTPLYRRSVCDEAGPWREDLRLEEDWEYDCRIAALGTRLVQCREFLAVVRDHEERRLSRHLSASDPATVTFRARARGLILEHARRAGIRPGSPEMVRFGRGLFLLSRQAGAAGLPALSRELFDRAREACGRDQARRLDFRLYRAAAAALGWSAAGRLACFTDRFRPEHTPLDRPTPPAAVFAGHDAGVPDLVSIVVPVYNRSSLLPEAVGSAIAQTHRPIEVLIVDDGSSDDTPAVCRDLAARHPEVRVLTRPNGGPGPARETGRLAARGEFLQYLDSDDRLDPRKLERQVLALRQKPDADVAYCRTREYRIGEAPSDAASLRTGEALETLFPALLSGRCWQTVTPLFRKRITDRVGPWSDLRQEEDWEYDARVAALGSRLVWCPEILADFRHHGGPRAGGGSLLDPTKMRARARAHVLIYRHARRAEIGPDSPGLQRFARSLFHLARECGASGLAPESRELFALAREASGPGRAWGADFLLYRVGAACLGWATVGRLARLSHRLRHAEAS